MKDDVLKISDTVNYKGKMYVVISKELYRGKWYYGIAKSVSCVYSKYKVARNQLKKVVNIIAEVKDIGWLKDADKSGLPLPKRFKVGVYVAEDANVSEIDKSIEKRIEKIYGVGYKLISYTTHLYEG